MSDFTPLGDESTQLALLRELRGASNELQKVHHCIWKLRGVAHKASDADPNPPFRKHVHEEYSAAIAGLRTLVELTDRLSRGAYCSRAGLDTTLSNGMGDMARHVLVREAFDEVRKTAHGTSMEARRLPETEQMWTLFLDHKRALWTDLARLQLLVGDFKRRVVATIDSIELTMYPS